MIEIRMYYDVKPGADWARFQDWAKRAIDLVLRAPGFIEMRSYRNVLGSPYISPVSRWQTLADWARFAESAEWKAVMNEAQMTLLTDIRTEIMEPSPVYPDMLYPKK